MNPRRPAATPSVSQTARPSRCCIAFGGGLTLVLGDAPARLTRQFREHPAHEPGDVPPGLLHPREPTGDPIEKLTFQRRPQAGLYAVARGHRAIF
ncbi:hypothetical protein GCM10023320_03150 [Pseudonocardia adelaidensis]|uniref:Uncharacterized protein n=1 Tax=Pseudonocardia adelaidensis TaxID=648754 RepID=A0ABP9N6Q4_9PSEU